MGAAAVVRQSAPSRRTVILSITLSGQNELLPPDAVDASHLSPMTYEDGHRARTENLSLYQRGDLEPKPFELRPPRHCRRFARPAAVPNCQIARAGDCEIHAHVIRLNGSAVKSPADRFRQLLPLGFASSAASVRREIALLSKIFAKSLTPLQFSYKIRFVHGELRINLGWSVVSPMRVLA